MKEFKRVEEIDFKFQGVSFKTSEEFKVGVQQVLTLILGKYPRGSEIVYHKNTSVGVLIQIGINCPEDQTTCVGCKENCYPKGE